MGFPGMVLAALFVVIVASGFGVYEWLATAGWAVCGLALWLSRGDTPRAVPIRWRGHESR
jgi:hypothetical protein